MKALITGGAGFIGSHLSDNLLARGWELVSVDDLSKGTTQNVAHLIERDDFDFIEMDCRDTDALQQAGGGVDVVVHLAATKIPRYASALGNVTTNLEGSRSALDVAAEQKAKFVLASTSDVYGRNPDLPFREDGNCVIGPSTVARWAYGVSKLCDEHMAFAYNHDFDVPVTILRFFGSYGERQYLNWWGGPQGVFLEAIAKGEPIEVHGDGSQTRCFTHIDDMAEATARAIESDVVLGQIINIGNDEEVSILGLAKVMHELSGRGGEPNIKLVPYADFKKDYQDVMRRIPDLTKQRDLLDFTPQVDLETGVKRLWSWYDALEKAPAAPNAA